MILYKCECGFEREVSDDSAGKAVKCPKCKTIGKVSDIQQFAKISSNPEDYADDPEYRPADGIKAADRPERTASSQRQTEANDVLLGVLYFIRIIAMLGAGITVIASALILMTDKKNAGLLVIVFVSGLASSIWTYVGAEAVRLLVEIERNTRKNT